jgi:hypothetical protein
VVVKGKKKAQEKREDDEVMIEVEGRGMRRVVKMQGV